MGKKKKKKLKKIKREKRKEEERERDSDSDAESNLSENEEVAEETEIFSSRLDDILRGCISGKGGYRKNHLTRYTPLCSLFEILTQKFNPNDFAVILEKKEAIMKVLHKFLCKKYIYLKKGDCNEFLVVLNIFSVCCIIFHNEEDEGTEEVEKYIRFLMEQYMYNVGWDSYYGESKLSMEVRCTIVKIIGVLYFLNFEEKYLKEEAIPFIKENFIGAKKLPTDVIQAGVKAVTLMTTSFEARDRISTVLQIVEGTFARMINRNHRFPILGAIGEFYCVVFDESNVVKRKKVIVSALEKCLKGKNKKQLNLKKKQILRSYLASLRNEYEIEKSIQLSPTSFLAINSWMSEVRYNYLKSILLSNMKHYVGTVELVRNLVNFNENSSNWRHRRTKREKEMDQLCYSERNEFIRMNY